MIINLKNPLIISLCVLMMCASNAQVLQVPLPEQPDAYTTDFLFIKNQDDMLKEKGAIPEIKSLSSSPVYNSGHVEAVYSRPTSENVRNILEKYHDIPGGITLEGSVQGVDIKKIQYQPDKNAFIINDRYEYRTILTPDEIKNIFMAISSNDLAGVSLGDRNVVYGSIEKGSIPAIFLSLADHYLGSIVFACASWVYRSALPQGYRPKTETSAKGVYAVYFNVNDFKFTIKDDDMISENARINITLIPLLPEKDQNGSYIPDYKMIESGMISNAFEQNCMHIARNIAVYSADSRLQRVVAYGEAAAIARALKANGINPSGLL